MKRKKRTLHLETLQPRDLMTVESLAWDGASSLRLSFVPDGTRVANQVSDANAVLSQSAAGANWKESVAKAFQVWAQYADINVGVVGDSGDPMGVAGPVRGDERFGEIRVAGIPMTSDTWAAAVGHDKHSAGTWAGDLLFNTDANWTGSADDLFKAALHEAGHVLGLPHNDDPNSPMHAHGIPLTATPAASDIALLRAMYGERLPDANELQKANDTAKEATRMRFSDDPTRFTGAKSLVHYGEIQNANDQDYFIFEFPNHYSGSITVHAVSKGLSQLQYRFSITDHAGNLLATGDSTAVLGGDIGLTINRPLSDPRVYFRVQPIGDAAARVGSYAIIAQLDALVTTQYADTLQATQRAHRWFASSPSSLTNFDVSSLVNASDDPVLNDDGGTDNVPADAKRVEPYVDSSVRRAALTIGTISTNSDTDYLRFRSPRPAAGKQFGMFIQVDSLERNQLVAKIKVFDAALNAVAAESIVNGNGEVVVWVPAVVPNQDYIVGIEGNGQAGATGNYEVAVSFQEAAPESNLLASAELTIAKGETAMAWYVARPQLFTLALNAQVNASNGAIGSVTGPAWVNIFDDKRRSVATIAGTIGELRTSPALLLLPGTYYLQFGAKPTNLTSSATIEMSLLGTADTDPIGPQPSAPGSVPVFTCPDTTVEFCYPGEVRTADPFIFVPDPVIVLPTTVPYPVVVPSDVWFWTSQFPRNNAVTREDVNGDGKVSPIDALLVINYLTRFKSGLIVAPPVAIPGMIDTNNDGIASPIDALLVINRLSRLRGQGEGEGESAVTPLAEPSVVGFSVTTVDMFQIEAEARKRQSLLKPT